MWIFSRKTSRSGATIHKRLSGKSVSKVKISRKTSSITIDIHTARPGQVIGKKGEDIDKLRNELNVLINKNRKNPLTVAINIEPIDKLWLDANLWDKRYPASWKSAYLSAAP
jgi:small subunit ribosomal protein S3